ncbi:MAG TPA: hypothetical protein VG649_04310 [Candidatus Angelobacter sp.]|jgi:hypothetical protein|nr:hypothetical protein [Candidatus Angelobacter sp.]
MKKLFTFVFTMLLGTSLAFAQATGGSTGADTTKAPTTKVKKHHGHKGGKKHKKGEGANTGTTNPK